MRINVACIAALAQIRYHGQWHFAAADPADALVLQFAQTAPPLARVAHHDLELFMTTLNSLHLHAVGISPATPPLWR